MKNEEKKEIKNKKADEQQQKNNSASGFKETSWVEHSDGEVVKLEPGDSIDGLLVDKGVSHKYNNCGVYKLTINGDLVPKVILGSVQLDRLMSTIDIGKEVKILFEGTTPSNKGNAMKIFKVFTKE